MNEDKAAESAEKLISWMESIGFEVEEEKESYTIKLSGKTICRISKEQLHFINGYLCGSLIKVLQGEY